MFPSAHKQKKPNVVQCTELVPEVRRQAMGRQHADEIELLIRPQEKDLGGFAVRRALPHEDRAMVGPFTFFDHMGPAQFPVGEGVGVRPHPHIGISAVTWLFDGEIVHRDSLGYVQAIRPGDVNFMIAGNGIVHSERTSEDEKARGARLHGIQLWLALPVSLEETEPAFTHYPAEAMPATQDDAVRATVVIGEAFGMISPVTSLSPTLYAEGLFTGAGTLSVPDNYEERAVYVVEGTVTTGTASCEAGDMAVLRPHVSADIHTVGPARVMLIGGEPFPEERTLYWNFVSSSPERIERAKRDWLDGNFAMVPGETEFIPLPDDS